MAADAEVVLSDEDQELLSSQNKDEPEKVTKARAAVGMALEEFLAGRAIELPLLKQFVRAQLKTYAPSTMWTRFSHMKRYIQEHYRVLYSPMQLKTISDYLSKKQKDWAPKKASIFRMEDIRAILSLLNTADKFELRNILIFLVGVFTLGRIGEVSRLNVGDITRESDGVVVHLARLKSCAADKDMRFLVPWQIQGVGMRPHWEAYLALIPSEGALWLRLGAKNLPRLGYGSVAEVTSELAKKLNLPDAEHYTFHGLRATGATLMVDGGCSLEQLMQAGNWKSQAAAEQYIRRSRRSMEIRAALIAGDAPPSPKRHRPAPPMPAAPSPVSTAPSSVPTAPQLSAPPQFVGCTFTNCTITLQLTKT
jgi:integrase